MKRSITSLSAWFLCLIFIGLTVTAMAGTVTITVYESDGTTPIQGVKVQYFSGTWKNLGTTDVNGEATGTITDGTYDFRATYKSTTSPNQSIVVSGTTTGTFYTTEVNVRAKTSASADLDGVKTLYEASGWKTIGTTASGLTTIELFPDTFDFQAQYKGSEATQEDKLVPGDGTTSGQSVTITFYTSNLIVRVFQSDETPIEGVSAKYQLTSGGGWKSMSATDTAGETSQETFGDKYDVEVTYLGVTEARNNQSLPVLPANGGDGSLPNKKKIINFYTTRVVVKVCDADSNPINGAVAKFKTNTWRTIGNTDVNGEVAQECFPSTGVLFTATYNYTTSPELSVKVIGSGSAKNKVMEVKFFASRLIAKTSCGGVNVANILTQFMSGSWRTIGNTDANGEAMIDIFPGTYDVRARNGGTEQLQAAQIVPGDGETAGQVLTVDFTPTAVTISHTSSVYYNSGGWQNASGTRYLFPGTYQFRFGPSSAYAYYDIAISGCELTKRIVILSLMDSYGDPIPNVSATGGTGSSYNDWGIDPTNTDGYAFDLVDPSSTNVNYQMVYNNTTAQKIQNVSVNPRVEFETEMLQLSLKTCDGMPISVKSATFGEGTNSTDFPFPGGPTGPTGLTGEAQLFPGNYSFQMNHPNLAQDVFNWDVPTDGALISFIEANVMTISLAVSAYGTCCNISTNGGSDGWIEVNVENSTSTTYTYTWTGTWSGAAPTGGNPTGLSSGVYKVLVTDSNGCYGSGGPVWLIEP